MFEHTSSSCVDAVYSHFEDDSDSITAIAVQQHAASLICEQGRKRETDTSKHGLCAGKSLIAFDSDVPFRLHTCTFHREVRFSIKSRVFPLLTIVQDRANLDNGRETCYSIYPAPSLNPQWTYHSMSCTYY